MATQTTDKSAKLVLFEAIQTALQPMIDADLIYSVEIFNSQKDYENQERFRGFPYIAVVLTVDWQMPEAQGGQNPELVQNYQLGICTVIVHHVFENISDETTAFIEAEPIRHKAYRCLHGLIDENYFTPLLRQSDDLDTSHDRVFDYTTVYATQLVESAFIPADNETVTDIGLEMTTDLKIDNETIRTGEGFNE